MSTEPTLQSQKPGTEFTKWTYLNPSIGDSYATHHSKEDSERVLCNETSILNEVVKESTAPIASSKEFLEYKARETNVLQGEWVMVREPEEWDMMPEMGKIQEGKKIEKELVVDGKESKVVVKLVVGWVSGQE